MRCENCPALETSGYEYPESYCSIYPEDDIYDFSDGLCGCKHPMNAIRKKLKEKDAAEAHRYDGIIEFYQEEDKKEQTLLETFLEVLKENDCTIAYRDSEGSLHEADISVFDESDQKLRCDSFTRKIIADTIAGIKEKNYDIVCCKT